MTIFEVPMITNAVCTSVLFTQNIMIGKEIFTDWNSLTHKIKINFFDKRAGYHNSYCTLQNVKLSHLTLFGEHPLNTLTHLTTFVTFKVLCVAQMCLAKCLLKTILDRDYRRKRYTVPSGVFSGWNNLNRRPSGHGKSTATLNFYVDYMIKQYGITLRMPGI